MELHAAQREAPMPQGHDDPVVRPRGDFEIGGNACHAE
jgi:hypothetical protein